MPPLEIGCGTGRNLTTAAARHPDTRLFGIDVSMEMLWSEIARIAAAGLVSQIRVAHDDAARLDPAPLFGVARFERIFISYSLSMIPQWPSGGAPCGMPLALYSKPFALRTVWTAGEERNVTSALAASV